MRRGLLLRLCAGGVFVAAVSVALLRPPLAAKPAPVGLVGRLFGGGAGHLAADVLWIRFERARREGRWALAYSHAESALALAPDSVAGWQALARHLAFERGEPGVGKTLEERAAWLQAALETLEAGERAGADAAELAFSAGALMAAEASLEPEDLAWPGGRAAAWHAAALAFERARRAGHPLGAEAAAAALARAREVEDAH